jgi:hypothetical protein
VFRGAIDMRVVVLGWPAFVAVIGLYVLMVWRTSLW